MNPKLLAGTSKGLVVFDCADWSVENVAFTGAPVSSIYVDERTHTWWVAVSHRHWGPKLHSSTDVGKSWQEVQTPSFKNYFDKPGKPATLKRIWVMQHAGHDRPRGIWLGTEPGGLFYSGDNGKTFSLCESLWNHPGRKDEKQWFGAGKDDPFLHSIVLDPNNSDHVYIGVSCAGIFETTDGGKSWTVRNKGLKAAYLPNPAAEMGHDPHRILICHNSKVIWQQNHCGIFRTTNGGASWDDVSGKNGFPSYGFALAIDEENENVAWVIPAQSDENRIPAGLKLTVCKTIDGGKSWKEYNKGLPGEYSFDLVLRQGFVRQGKELCFGTNNGNLYASHDGGESWTTISKNLAPVNCLTFSSPEN